MRASGSLLPTLLLLCLAVQGAASPRTDDAPAAPKLSQQVLFGFRGQGPQVLDSWSENGITYFLDYAQNQVFKIAFGQRASVATSSPERPQALSGPLKFRHGSWWFLQPVRGHLPEDQVSILYHYQAPEKAWKALPPLEGRAANFEVLADGRIALFGYQKATGGSRAEATYPCAIRSVSGAVSNLGEIPFPEYADLLWKTCLTTQDGAMAYAYFPGPGHLYGYDLAQGSLRSFATPWAPLTSKLIQEEREKATGRFCIVDATGHPGLEHGYFAPVSEGRMLFIYKALDQEREKAVAALTGSRPVIEKVAAYLLYAADPGGGMEWAPPSRQVLDPWIWDSSSGRLVKLEDLQWAKPLGKATAETPRANRSELPAAVN